MVAEGVDVFRIKIPPALIGKTVKSACIFEECGCNVIGMNSKGSMIINSNLETILPDEGEIILIGSVESQDKFFRRYRPKV
jgi:Trk K+ transport system NAD-binding subunit